MKLKRVLAITVAVIAFGSGAAFALDTNEAVSVGIVTDFEAYYSRGFSEEGNGGHNFDFTVAGGILENLSWFLGGSFTHNGDGQKESSFNNLGLNFLWTPLETKQFALDIMPNVGVEASKARTDGADTTISYPNGNIWTFGVDFEFNLTMMAVVQPYVQFGFNMAHYAHPDGLAGGIDGADSLMWNIPLALGIAMPVSDTVEFLVQFSATVETEWDEKGKSKVLGWGDMNRHLACGLNFMMTEHLEGLTEVGWEFTGNEFNMMAGLIYSL